VRIHVVIEDGVQISLSRQRSALHTAIQQRGATLLLLVLLGGRVTRRHCSQGFRRQRGVHSDSSFHVSISRAGFKPLGFNGASAEWGNVRAAQLCLGSSVSHSVLFQATASYSTLLLAVSQLLLERRTHSVVNAIYVGPSVNFNETHFLAPVAVLLG